MKNIFIWTILFLFNKVLHAQPEMHDGGLIIREVYVGSQLFMPQDNAWVNKSHSSIKEKGKLSVSHFTLNKKGKESKKPLAPVDLSDYDLVKTPNFPFAIYLPPYVGKRTTLNQRLIFSYNKDTMIVDILNIPERSYTEPFTLGALHFKPGKYEYNFNGQKELIPKDTHEASWLTYYRHKGITPESEPYLVKYGYLTCVALNSGDIKASWKYVVPQVKVEQYSPYHAFIEIQGNFLGQIAEVYITETIINPYYQIEYFQDNEWKIIPRGIGLDYKKDSLNVASRFYKQRFIQLTSEAKHSFSGLKPGKYRVKMVTSKKEIITSVEFYLGMLESNKNSPYQTLYRDSLGFPSYTLDVNDDIYIQTPFLPILLTDSINKNKQTYHFRYFDSQDYDHRPIGYPTDPEDTYTQHFIPLVSKRKVYINGVLYNGQIKFAFSNTSSGINSRLARTDIFIIEYINGSPIEVKLLKDVDLKTETTPMRNN
jgi:hypothetical protein